jgi:hypothetical protein
METSVVFSVPMKSGIMLTFGTEDTGCHTKPGGRPGRVG